MRSRPIGAAVAAALAAALLALDACASIAAGPPAGPSPFLGVKKLVLVRRVDDARAPRGRDPLDALKETLDARGYETRIVEIGSGEDAGLRDVDRLEDRIAARMWNRARTAGRPESIGADAGAVVAKLGVDALVGYHRLQDQLPPLPPPAPLGAAPYPARQAAPPRRPAGALSLLAASGSVAWFPWGGREQLEPGALINPAEAIDAVVAALSASAGDDDGG
jgi:hypothetical protein